MSSPSSSFYDVTIKKGEKLCLHDGSPAQDCSLRLSLGGQVKATTTKRNLRGKKAVWMESFSFHTNSPTDSILTIEAVHTTTRGSGETLGTAALRLGESQGGTRTVPLYGKTPGDGQNIKTGQLSVSFSFQAAPPHQQQRDEAQPEESPEMSTVEASEDLNAVEDSLKARKCGWLHSWSLLYIVLFGACAIMYSSCSARGGSLVVDPIGLPKKGLSVRSPQARSDTHYLQLFSTGRLVLGENGGSGRVLWDSGTGVAGVACSKCSAKKNRQGDLLLADGKKEILRLAPDHLIHSFLRP